MSDFKQYLERFYPQIIVTIGAWWVPILLGIVFPSRHVVLLSHKLRDLTQQQLLGTVSTIGPWQNALKIWTTNLIILGWWVYGLYLWIFVWPRHDTVVDRWIARPWAIAVFVSGASITLLNMIALFFAGQIIGRLNSPLKSVIGSFFHGGFELLAYGLVWSMMPRPDRRTSLPRRQFFIICFVAIVLLAISALSEEYVAPIISHIWHIRPRGF